MIKIIFYLMFCFLFLSVQLNAQENFTAPVQSDVISIGFGFGQEYGGFGVNMFAYPQRNIGIFGGLGGKLNGVGYNVGLKFRHISRKPTARVNPYAVVMYGYNTAVVVNVLTLDYNKIFYGPSVGIGMDLKSRPMSKFYYSFGMNIPFRGPEVNDYLNDLRTNEGLDVSNDLPPVTFSIGFKYIILRKNL